MSVAYGVLGTVMVLMGLGASAAGILLARQGLQAARRTYQRTQGRHAPIPDDWDAWFLSGFSGMTLGLRWLSALGGWLLWTLAGAGFVVLGFRLFAGWPVHALR